MPRLVRARLARLAQANFASMKCVVALALAFTARASATDVDWRIPGGNQLPPVTVDPAADGKITFKWNGFHNVYEMPSEAAMNASVKINESEVIQADVMASNGVIHVIDAVLMPPSDEEPTKGPTAMEESDSAGRASLAVAAAAAVAYVL